MYRTYFLAIVFFFVGCSGTSDLEDGLNQASIGVPPDPSKKVLLVFIDGFIPAAISTSDTPVIDSLLADSAWSLTARAESTTISGSGWSSFLTGVHWDKHRVNDNNFTNPNYTDYPHIFARVKETFPAAVVGGCQSWEPIETGLVLPAEPDFSAFHNYYDYSDDYWDQGSADTLCAQEVVGFAAEGDIDLLVMMFAELDGVGHESGFGAEYATYQAMLAKTDNHIGQIVEAIEARPSYPDEDWLVIVSTDHSGEPELHHGANIPEHRLIPFIMSGPSVATGEIWPPPQTVDIVPTALYHLGVQSEESWNIDGVVVGFEPTSAPIAQLGENLIFNGDAEYERGYEGYDSVPDAWIPGWYDPGYLTVVQYDSLGGYPSASGPGPDNRGPNFFAGGWTDADTYASWDIHVSSLATAIDAGVMWTLTGWLGGYVGQNDRASLTAVFMDDLGSVLDNASIGPVTADERNNITSLVDRTATGSVPIGTRKISVKIDAVRASGYNDGYADNLSLVLTVN